MDGTHTGKFGAESVRGRKAECMVQRQILSPGAAAAKRVQWTKQRATAGAALRFSQAATRHENRLSARELGGRNFCRATARRNGFPLNRGAGRLKKARCNVYKITKGFFGWNVKNKKCKPQNALLRHAAACAEREARAKNF